MKHLLLLLVLSVSSIAYSQEKPISTTYNCIDTGCTLTCLNFKNNWSTVSNEAIKATVKHFSNGNIEFLLNFKSNARGSEAIFISEQRLKCKLSGISNN